MLRERVAGDIYVFRSELWMALPVDLPAGSYTLAVGWYDAAPPAQRLAAQGTKGQLLENDLLVLPAKVGISP